MTTETIDRQEVQQIAGVVIPAIGAEQRFDEERFSETQGLVEALGVQCAFVLDLKVRSPNASILLGGGQLDMIGSMLEEQGADILVVDCTLSPVQQRNLERRLQVKIVDRIGLILEIFSRRARSAEGRLQVEMARTMYERSRLVRTWTHLERQRGGRGFLAGPGESQLEADRRMLDRHIASLKADLDKVHRTRELQRAGRSRRETPVVALVGYTNAGKSTLFNKLTDADVFAADMPFATLDPTIRNIELPSGKTIALVDTVGFITDLPTHLVESFKATIEEAIEADLILHVRDIASGSSARQATDVEDVLLMLEKSTGLKRPPMVEVWNKIDALAADEGAALEAVAAERYDVACTSAITGRGVSDLLEIIEREVFGGRKRFQLSLSPTDSLSFQMRAWLFEHGVVEDETTTDAGETELTVTLTESDFSRFVAKYGASKTPAMIML